MSAVNEMSVFYEYLMKHTATCSMVSDAIGIKQKNLCRYKVALQKANLLWELFSKPCKVTGYKAAYLTTNKDLISTIDKNQLSLFQGKEATNE